MKLLAYNPDHRASASSILKHPYFRDLREKDQMMNPEHYSTANGKMTQPSLSGAMRLTHRGSDSMS